MAHLNAMRCAIRSACAQRHTDARQGFLRALSIMRASRCWRNSSSYDDEGRCAESRAGRACFAKGAASNRSTDTREVRRARDHRCMMTCQLSARSFRSTLYIYTAHERATAPSAAFMSVSCPATLSISSLKVRRTNIDVSLRLAR